MPDWWEKTIGSDPNTANNNDDPDHDGWTLLEDYLDFMAHPYIMLQPDASGTLDVKPYFAGFYGQNGKAVTPTYTVAPQGTLLTASVNSSVVTVNAAQQSGVGTILVTVNDGETTFTQRFGVAITTDATSAIRPQTPTPTPSSAASSSPSMAVRSARCSRTRPTSCALQTARAASKA